MLEKLTPKQERLLDAVAEEYILGLVKPKKLVMATINKWLDIAYSLYDLKRPGRVEVVDSPPAALTLSNELTGAKDTDLDWCGVGDGGWVAFYDYFNRIGILKDDEAIEVLALREFGAMAWDTVLLDECAIVVRRPVAIHLDDDGNLHSPPHKPCIEWADGEKDYAHRGAWVDERFVMAPEKFTAKEYMALTNTEERRCIGERAGWQFIAELLGARPVNSWTDPKTSLVYDLLELSDGSKLLRKQSPKLRNNEQPIYLEPVNRALVTAAAARKWQATSLTPEQCEFDPHLTYAVET